MARFMKRQIDQMEKRFPCVVGFEWREHECFAPPEKPEKQRQPADERHRVRRGIRVNEPLLGKGHPARAILCIPAAAAARQAADTLQR